MAVIGTIQPCAIVNDLKKKKIRRNKDAKIHDKENIQQNQCANMDSLTGESAIDYDEWAPHENAKEA